MDHPKIPNNFSELKKGFSLNYYNYYKHVCRQSFIMNLKKNLHYFHIYSPRLQLLSSEIVEIGCWRDERTKTLRSQGLHKF